MWKKTLALAVGLSLLATPVMAKPWRARHGHKPGGHAHRAYSHYRPGAYFGAARYYRGHGYRHRHRHHHGHVDSDVFLWLGLTALGLTAINALTYQQRVRYEEAHWDAAAAPIGSTITWSDGPVSGAVTPVREGIAESGEYCREFQRDVQIGGRTERAWGTACLGEDGAWRLTR